MSSGEGEKQWPADPAVDKEGHCPEEDSAVASGGCHKDEAALDSKPTDPDDSSQEPLAEGMDTEVIKSPCDSTDPASQSIQADTDPASQSMQADSAGMETEEGSVGNVDTANTSCLQTKAAECLESPSVGSSVATSHQPPTAPTETGDGASAELTQSMESLSVSASSKSPSKKKKKKDKKGQLANLKATQSSDNAEAAARKEKDKGENESVTASQSAETSEAKAKAKKGRREKPQVQDAKGAQGVEKAEASARRGKQGRPGNVAAEQSEGKSQKDKGGRRENQQAFYTPPPHPQHPQGQRMSPREQMAVQAYPDHRQLAVQVYPDHQREVQLASCSIPPEVRRLQQALQARAVTPNQQYNQRGQKGSGKKQQPKKNIFEPYWPMDKVSEGLKRGVLIEGRLRINPRNYEDAYVPLPDGMADVYISGMPDRNRALNGDIVAVLLQDRENWRVFEEEVNHYEKKNTPTQPAADVEAERPGVETGEAMDVDDEEPDVVVEEEETVQLDEAGNPIESTRVVNAAPTQPTSTPSSSTPATPAPGKSQTPSSGKAAGREKGTPCSSGKQKRYMSVKDVLHQGSPLVKTLFSSPGGARGAEGVGENADDSGASVNMDKFMQRTGKVVAIIEKKHSRAASGNLRPLQDSSHNFATFAPTDSRIPRIMVPTADLPKGFKDRPGDFTSVLFIARITEWNECSKMPKGSLARSLGEAGQVEPETEALLIENDVDCSEFSDKVLACLPQETPWTIPAEELRWRRDLRKECIFTIDPATARDLDDALHCTDLGDGVYEVGVHIADVSYFVKEHTELDDVASNRATSVYLVQKVVPMLPRLLCEQLCSLNPDEDRLSFSVIWKMTDAGEILEEWFGRTVIRSCVKLSYDHAQGFIDDPTRQWSPDELPPISKGFSVRDIKSRVLQMNKMAKAMRKARFDSGALRLDQIKIQYTLNHETGLPYGYSTFHQRDSNKLVEEFMLLANMAVAHRIRTTHRDKALLRRHPPPQSRMIDELKEVCASLGYPLEVKSAKEIQMSLARYTGEDELSKARVQVLVVLCSRPMQNAKYFCCGVLADEALYRHYALNVPLYTHFTSPIRRYPDILVHRTLAASLGYCDVSSRSPFEIHRIAEHCNDKKTNAKLCSEKSNELYFSIFVKEAGPLEEKGMVMAVLDKSFDVYILSLGVVKRVYCEKLPLERFTFHKEGKRPELTMVWKGDDGCPTMLVQKINIFSCVNCVLKSEAEPLRWSATIRRPVAENAS